MQSLSEITNAFDDVPAYIELNMADVDSKAAFDPEAAGLVPGPNITVDSGAAISVTNPDVFPQCVVQPSVGSKAGQRFVGVGGPAIPNLGQITPEMVLETGDVGSVNFQAAEVRKPLMAVSDVNKKKNPCWFDGNDSHIIPSSCPQLPEIRRLISEAQRKVPLHLEKGVYHMKTWIKPTTPFPGQGW